MKGIIYPLGPTSLQVLQYVGGIVGPWAKFMYGQWNGLLTHS